MIKAKKICGQTEYTEAIKHICGHTVNCVTLEYKIPRKQVAEMRQKPCPRCYLKMLLDNNDM
mgnify:FL=1